MKNLLSLRCCRFLCPVMAVIITFAPLVSFGAWSIDHWPMSVTQMEKVKTDGKATAAGQLRDIKGAIQTNPGSYQYQGTIQVRSIDSGMPGMPMYTWKAEVPPTVAMDSESGHRYATHANAGPLCRDLATSEFPA